MYSLAKPGQCLDDPLSVELPTTEGKSDCIWWQRRLTSRFPYPSTTVADKLCSLTTNWSWVFWKRRKSFCLYAFGFLKNMNMIYFWKTKNKYWTFPFFFLIPPVVSKMLILETVFIPIWENNTVVSWHNRKMSENMKKECISNCYCTVMYSRNKKVTAVNLCKYVRDTLQSRYGLSKVMLTDHIRHLIS